MACDVIYITSIHCLDEYRGYRGGGGGGGSLDILT